MYNSISNVFIQDLSKMDFWGIMLAVQAATWWFTKITEMTNKN